MLTRGTPRNSALSPPATGIPLRRHHHAVRTSHSSAPIVVAPNSSAGSLHRFTHSLGAPSIVAKLMRRVLRQVWLARAGIRRDQQQYITCAIPRDACGNCLSQRLNALLETTQRPDPITSTAMNAYLQRADDFIIQQIQRLEQKKRGKEYYEMKRANSRRQRQQQNPTRANPCDQPMSPITQLPRGWTQALDRNTQRWYYINQTSGQAQWSPPSASPSPTTSLRSPSLRHTMTGGRPGDGRPPLRLDEDVERASWQRKGEGPHTRGRAGAASRQEAGDLGVACPSRPTSSTSSHSIAAGRLPPGKFLDMKTGQVVDNMYPPDHPINTH
jgi:hypothetical protein